MEQTLFKELHATPTVEQLASRIIVSGDCDPPDTIFLNVEQLPGVELWANRIQQCEATKSEFRVRRQAIPKYWLTSDELMSTKDQ